MQVPNISSRAETRKDKNPLSWGGTVENAEPGLLSAAEGTSKGLPDKRREVPDEALSDPGADVV